MLIFFLLFPHSRFIQFFFHRHSRACRESDHRAEVFGGDLCLRAPPLFIGILIFIQ